MRPASRNYERKFSCQSTYLLHVTQCPSAQKGLSDVNEHVEMTEQLVAEAKTATVSRYLSCSFPALAAAKNF
jgi:hypothetical protein